MPDARVADEGRDDGDVLGLLEEGLDVVPKWVTGPARRQRRRAVTGERRRRGRGGVMAHAGDCSR